MPAAGPRHGGRLLVLLATGLCILTLGASVVPVQSRGAMAPAPRAQLNFLKPFFYGRAYIAGQPADDGTYVDAVVIRGVNDYVICGLTKVGKDSEGFGIEKKIGPGAYLLPIDTAPECMNPQTRYTLFINMVRATEVPNPGFTIAGGNFRVYLQVPEVALVTKGGDPTSGRQQPYDTSAPIVYFYGAVRNGRGPVRNGTVVTVKSQDDKCSAEGPTGTLYWVPKNAPKSVQPVGILGFYYVAIVDISGRCADRLEQYRFYVKGVLINPPVRWQTPPYAMAERHDLFAPLAP